jgi:hypothetical protein
LGGFKFFPERSSLLPSGKHTKNYGKSPFLMGKSTISMAIFNSYVKLPEGKGFFMIFPPHFALHLASLDLGQNWAALRQV